MRRRRGGRRDVVVGTVTPVTIRREIRFPFYGEEVYTSSPVTVIRRQGTPLPGFLKSLVMLGFSVSASRCFEPSEYTVWRRGFRMSGCSPGMQSIIVDACYVGDISAVQLAASRCSMRRIGRSNMVRITYLGR